MNIGKKMLSIICYITSANDKYVHVHSIRNTKKDITWTNQKLKLTIVCKSKRVANFTYHRSYIPIILVGYTCIIRKLSGHHLSVWHIASLYMLLCRLRCKLLCIYICIFFPYISVCYIPYNTMQHNYPHLLSLKCL